MPEVREATPEEIARYQEASKFVSHKVKAVRKRQAGHPIMEGVCRCGHRFAACRPRRERHSPDRHLPRMPEAR